ncbi:MAG: 30S ribosomal protein S4 [Candidatus Yanofskybacteria bacterium RIFOXYD1_FULL_44_17]|uniref:Small ribosomal subunit protein uS4 n=1 Tax=Candidatus Yanofskybacteria bacterium GW2011_GWE2_40_11 TaxID=1619033 RepID=A0A0G0TTH1_9BACT|nr:MAG: 30S ribosomal protein S4 [Candidatus Yanofskybacteria bacterium GW2011_GWE2_40_11]OGN36217.1 MAG: 30S ribosomal protein S4 [Candidatus Yanofskybacteria bacterium RIFOXYA2_FULL_45_28]OGN36933.1 MAG: 30S ribosomal protein S4 [Candidatus Yanofskybacteria bacterium RIFOXYA1_FULL_44_17]OGN38376.1 MAG: 30S ribosomal protein S4 [Candidatus Yanofskybacteria bacterium RIFOXYC1_FULL_44_16]OGN38555.1 MAG: 30S ribosomal protein S4 [Candidatus Yanofskybacteria bacterium RIFOXYB2_FULL_44_18]OGN38733
MARYLGPREKVERRVGERLFLKGDRSYSPKAAVTRRPYPPGQHTRRNNKISEFGQQLMAKQKVRATYRMLEKQFKNGIKHALESREEPYTEIIGKLENRLDNTVFRSGFAQSRDQARQLVSHGHILVNGKKVNIPSYTVKRNDIISVREGSKKTKYFTTLLPVWFPAYQGPGWIEINKEKVEAKVKGQATLEESGLKMEDLQAVVEYYSR